MSLAHVVDRLTGDGSRLALAVDARRIMLGRCMDEIEVLDRERVHAGYLAESAREQLLERKKEGKEVGLEREVSLRKSKAARQVGPDRQSHESTKFGLDGLPLSYGQFDQSASADP